jgi:hypothetical protein
MFSLEAEERIQKQLLDDVMTEALHKEKNVERPQANQNNNSCFYSAKKYFFMCAEGIFSYQILNIHGQWIFYTLDVID